MRNVSIARRNGAVSTPHRVRLSSAAASLDQEPVAERFPGAIEIVDINHAKQHLRDAANAIYGAGTGLPDARAEAPLLIRCSV